MIKDLAAFTASVPKTGKTMKLLSCRGRNIVDADGNIVHLRGANVGSWMNMEYYLHGFFGSEHDMRAVAADLLGEEKGSFIFESMMKYFFTEKDVAYLKGIGTTVIRLPLNARHFEEEGRPFHYLESGFAKLEEALGWCEKYGMYVILDMHAVFGCQNGSWHSDNASGEAHFWRNPHYLDRFVRLWEEMARRYRGRAVIAGYELMNEPETKDRYGRIPIPMPRDPDAINEVYHQAVAAIRRLDPEHIIFLDGDNYSENFMELDAPFAENLVYASHNYSFRAISAPFYPGVGQDGCYWDQEQLRREFYEKEGTRFCQKYQVPLFVGEFGSRNYTQLMEDQIGVFEEFGAHWTTWQHKDVGYSSLLRYRHDCEYLQKFNDILDRFGTVYGGINGRSETPARREMREMCRRFEDALTDAAESPWATKGDSYLLPRWIDDCYYAKIICYEFVKRFEPMSMEEIDHMFQSFAIENCWEHPLSDAVKHWCQA